MMEPRVRIWGNLTVTQKDLNRWLWTIYLSTLGFLLFTIIYFATESPWLAAFASLAWVNAYGHMRRHD